MFKGKTIKTFVWEEPYEGIKLVELSNWSGAALFCERHNINNLKSLIQNQNFTYSIDTGVYFLLSNDDTGTSSTDIYIGETDDFLNRIINHVKHKDWWSDIMLFFSKDLNLTKAHVRYLEKVLWERAKQSLGTLNVKNEHTPGGANLPFNEKCDMDDYIENLVFILSSLGLSHFKNKSHKRKKFQDNEFKLDLTKNTKLSDGNQASAFLSMTENEYILLKGSYIIGEARDSFKGSSYYNLWNNIINSNAVEKIESLSLYKVLEDISFKSPSAAGAIVRARSINGRTAWQRLSDGKTLAEVEFEEASSKQ